MATKAGCRFPVSMGDVFPDRCYLVPDSISEAQDYDEKTEIRTPQIDKVTSRCGPPGSRRRAARLPPARTRRDGRPPGGRPGGAGRCPVGRELPDVSEPVTAAGPSPLAGRCW